MNEKREVILPSDFSGEEGKIVCYRISPCPELDKELLLNGRNTKMSVEWEERHHLFRRPMQELNRQ